MMTSTVAWEACGEVNIVDGRPVFPEVVSAPGLYRLRLNNGWWYLGESADLQRAFLTTHGLVKGSSPIIGFITH